MSPNDRGTEHGSTSVLPPESTIQGGLQQNPGLKFLLIAAALVVVIHGLRLGAPILVPFLLAVFLAVLNLPLLGWIQSKRIPSVLAIIGTVLANAVLLGVLLMLVLRTVEEFVATLPRYVTSLQAMAESLIERVEDRGVAISPYISPDLINLGAVMEFVGGTLRGVAAFLTAAFLVLLLLVFVLAEATDFPAKLRAAMGRADADLSRLANITRDVQRYLGIKTLVSMATGVLVGVWVWLLGVDFPLLWGLVAFLFNYIPSIGSILAAIPPFLLTLVQFGPSRAVFLLVGYLGVNMVLGNLVEPRVMGRKLGLSPLVVILSLVFWGWIWGVVGMFLAVPLTMIVRIMLEHTRDFRWVAILLSGGPAERPPA